VKKVSTKKLNKNKFLAARIEENNASWDISTKPKIGIL
jgi:hypothetical protein